MKNMLFRQMEDRRMRDIKEKEHNDEQARIWKLDLKNFTEEEKRIAAKIKKNNNDTAEFLRKQIEEKSGVVEVHHGNMNRNEFLLNKGILRDVNVKLRILSREKSERNQASSHYGS